MKNKKAIIITVIITILLISSGILYFVFTTEDEETTLSLVDKKWIESNKNKVFDIAVVNNIPVFNYKGNGVFFEFISAIENDTKLDFNPISYNYGSDSNSSYAFKITKELNENDLILYEDNYVLVGTNKNKYNSLKDINNVTIGVFDEQMDLVSKYVNTDIELKKYETIEELISAVVPVEGESEVELIAIPKMVYLEQIISEEELNIVYNISDLKEYYVLSLGNDERLNSIMNKYFVKWYNEKYNSAYKKHMNSNYFTFKKIDDTAKAKLKSKEYTYGFVDNAPYDLLNSGKLLGINSNIIKDFADLVGVELNIQKYDTVSKLVDAFNSNEIDFMFNNTSIQEYKMDVYETTSFYDEKMVVISNIENNIIVNSLNSLIDSKILTVGDTKVSKMLFDNGNVMEIKNNLNELLQTISKNDIAILDYDTYNYYSKTKLKDYKVDYTFNLNDNYNYVMRDISENEIFNQYFDFYLSFINEKHFINNAYLKLSTIKLEENTDKILVSLISIIIVLLILIVVLKKILFKNKKKKRVVSMSKSDKLRYIDVLTSLKNRNYLNDHIEIWDDNEIYPQTVVVIDLNNIAYINDNYGHQEGDNVIKDAANILIKNQLENTEIIRTNGNEFLIYMIGYEEKQVISYLRKINKELKDLSHGFGAASGYSMITDAIKTIDDAVNEATLDMRNNKEELNN